MDQTQRIHEITRLRAEFRHNGRLRLEYLAAMSRLFREHGVAIDDESLANMVPADIGELHAEGQVGGPRPLTPSTMVGGPRPSGPSTMVGGPRPSGPSTGVGGPRPSGPSTGVGGPRPSGPSTGVGGPRPSGPSPAGPSHG